ncbi:hypothetical protein ACOSQ2_032183 [Xanthoceras sorbifolium]
MVVKIQAIEEGKVVKVTGMGIINLLAKSALVLVTQLCRVIADIIELLLKVTTITMLVTMRVQLIIELCMFKLSRAFSRATPLVIHMGVVTTICRMVKADFASGPVSQSTKSSLVCNSSAFVSENACQSFLLMLPMVLNRVEHLLFYLVKALM